LGVEVSLYKVPAAFSTAMSSMGGGGGLGALPFLPIPKLTTLNQQGNDIGTSYRSAIFYQDEDERKQAEDFIKIVNDSKRWPNPVVTTLEPFTNFFRAEEYHQDFLQKNPGGYTCHYVRPKWKLK
jgi:peptide-methionine (S)-S-oxide reductase